MQGINYTPTPYFQDSPAWMREGSTDGYVNTCQASKPGDPIQPLYLDGILAATLVSEAIAAYDTGATKKRSSDIPALPKCLPAINSAFTTDFI